MWFSIIIQCLVLSAIYWLVYHIKYANKDNALDQNNIDQEEGEEIDDSEVELEDENDPNELQATVLELFDIEKAKEQNSVNVDQVNDEITSQSDLIDQDREELDQDTEDLTDDDNAFMTGVETVEDPQDHEGEYNDASHVDELDDLPSLEFLKET